MIVFVRYNCGPVVALEVQQEAPVSEVKELVGGRHGVRPQELKVLFAGKELLSTDTLQSCEVPEQSTVHVVLCSSGSASSPQEGAGPSRSHLSSAPLGTTQVEEREWERQPAAQRGVRSFFVYCKSCSSVQPGKLRVRCRRCKETTLKLGQDPSCWEDILLPGRIHGICQSDGCHGDEAEFFMKCGSHPTSDADPSVALDLITTNSRNVPCIACTDVMEVVVLFPCSERHVICLDCFARYCQSRLSERRFVFDAVVGYTLPCAATCDDSLIKETHHFRILGEEQYGRYLQYGAEECLLRIGGLMCPSAGCGAGLLPSDGGRRVECERPAGCGLVFCRDCRGRYHQGACSQSHTQVPPADGASQGFAVEEEASLRGRWEEASQQLIRESTKRCPRCSVPVERNGGCMHMHCPQCEADWCWSCGGAWSPQCTENHWFA